MTYRNDEAAFNDRVRRMIRGWQKVSGKNHQEMADFLSTSGFTITKDQYQSYVRPSGPRTFPPFVIWRFCAETKIALDGVPFEGDKPQEPVTKLNPSVARREELSSGRGKRRADRIIKQPKRTKEQDKNDKSSAD